MEDAVSYSANAIQSEITHISITNSADHYRVDAYEEVDHQERAQRGQYFTPPAVARLMASLFHQPPDEVRLLDAGAGVGALTAAFVENMLTRRQRPRRIHVTAYENETRFRPYLEQTLKNCRALCQSHDVTFLYTIKTEDFIASAATILRPRLFDRDHRRFNCAILNPPYKKINSKSHTRQLLSEAGIETVNLYTAFLALAIKLLQPNGQLVAITPRSFCNGPYYKSFRRFFADEMAFRHIHLFDSREEAFSDDDILQENIIFHAVKRKQREDVTITSSVGPEDDIDVHRHVAYHRVINPDDPQLFIHISASELDHNIADRIALFPCTLATLGIDVSTGRVVDFRAKPYLRQQPEANTVPLIYPHHMRDGFVQWPQPESRKPNAFVNTPETARWLLPSGYYVIVRRFSSKEEARRINAAVFDPHKIPGHAVAFENHINVFHAWNRGMNAELARGLAIYLNSTLLDAYFRQFNGHTQVNATDLRSLHYPNRETLLRWGATYIDHFPDQETIDFLIESELQKMAELETPDPIAAKKRVDEALQILIALGLPRGQQNERSAMTLLALLDLPPEKPWSEAGAPLMGITPIMTFIRDHYGVEYAPNTRETIRRQSVHQFVQAGLVIENPDKPDRPKNSPNWCYQIEPAALDLLQSFNSDRWDGKLEAYLEEVDTLQARYARQRELNRVPVQIAPGLEITLSPGSHSQLIKNVIEEFAPRFAPGGQLIYVGDTGDKWGYFDEKLLSSLGVSVDQHGKMPDVIIYYTEKEWLLLIEAVTSHGPVDPKRRIELQELFSPALDKLVFVTAFTDKGELARHLPHISWATEVWIADNPSHLIHFDGTRFLGPYGNVS